MPPAPSLGAITMLRQALCLRQRAPALPFPSLFTRIPAQSQTSAFSTSPAQNATYNQVRKGCRVAQSARKARSPALKDRPEMKGVCLKTGTTKPKKPNSGERKIARIKLSNGKVVTGYIPGEGELDVPFFFVRISWRIGELI